MVRLQLSESCGPESMAAYFGEVREIPSRAVDDDEEVDVELPTVYFDLPEFSDITQLPSYDTVSIFPRSRGGAHNRSNPWFSFVDSERIF